MIDFQKTVFEELITAVILLSIWKVGSSQSLGGSLYCFHFLRDSCILLMVVTENYFAWKKTNVTSVKEIFHYS